MPISIISRLLHGKRSRNTVPELLPFQDAPIHNWLAYSWAVSFTVGETEYTDRQFQHAIRVIRTYQQVFGRRYYIEVQRFSSFERTCILNPAPRKSLVQITEHYWLQHSDVHYPYKSDTRMQSILYGAHHNADIQELETQLGTPWYTANLP